MKLIKRQDGAAAPYYCRFQVRSRQYWWSTKTASLPLAKLRAKEYRDLVVGGAFGLANGMKERCGSATFEELMAEYDLLPSPSAAVKVRNKRSLLVVLGASGFDGQTTVDRLGKDVAGNWQKYALRQGMPPVTINSRLRGARSIFSKDSLNLYPKEVQPTPDAVHGLFSVSPLFEAERLPELPTPEADAKAHATLPAIPAIYRAFVLARYGGLRSAEIMAAKRGWLVGTTLWIGGRPEYETKSGKWRKVSLPQPVADLLQECDTEFFAGPHPQQLVARDLPAALHSCGFPARKPLHSLRRLFGSLVYSTQGPAFAKHALGHSSQQVTDSHYCRLLTDTMPIAYAGPLVLPTPAPIIPIGNTG